MRSSVKRDSVHVIWKLQLSSLGDWYLEAIGAIYGVQVTNWSGACYIFPLLGAFVADSYLGRYTTIIVFSTIYTIVWRTLLHCIAFAALPLGCAC